MRSYSRVFAALRPALILAAALCATRAGATPVAPEARPGAPPVIELSDDLARVGLGRRAEYLKDENATLTAVEASAVDGYFRSDNETPTFGFTKAAVWTRFQVRNASNHDDWLLELDAPLTESAEVYWLLPAEGATATPRYESVRLYAAGLERPFSERPRLHRSFIFPLVIPPGATWTIYMRVRSSAAMTLPLAVWRERDFYSDSARYNWYQGIYFGVIGIMMIYNLILFLIVRERSYIYYVAYVFAGGVFILSQTGFGYELVWSQWPWFALFVNQISVAAYMGFFLLFTTAFLQTDRFLPRSDQALRWIAHVWIIFAGVLCFLPFQFSARLNSYAAIATLLSAMIIGLIVARARFRPAYYFVFAFCGFFAGGILYALKSSALIAATPFSTYGLQIGTLIEISLLSIGLAHRIRILRAEKDRMRESSRLKSLFLANMSHEIRTPLNAILGMSHMLAGARLNGEERGYLDVLQRASEGLLTLVNDILDLSKIEAGELNLVERPFRLETLLADLDAFLQPMAQARDLSLSVGPAPGLCAGKALLGDSGRLRQILLNLGVNAIKFTERGGVRIEIEAEATGRERLQLLFTVRDTGVGIAAEDQTRIFETFVQADASYTRGQSGVGLGLAICRQIAEKMGGDIALESAPGRGSAFFLRLPFVLRPDVERPEVAAWITPASDASSPSTVKLASERPPAIERTVGRILVAEDNPDNRLLLSAYLKSAQYELQFADNGQAAIDALDAAASAGRGFELVLMDIQMPVLDGLSAVREIRRRETAFFRERTPVVAVTAHAFEEEAERCLEAGCDGYLSKPIRREELLATIATHVRNNGAASG